ncbi:serine/threonine-protein phosphatase 6 regulatory ankyrin repeat subunit A [Biomphalaria pfeifferi]|uniref:Serine/threonine-protein phosphatase 6 regulatory ankyrin repeat subunit A n=1 Tax=Biomphalaria pfeifferi TaxID=112525 RepID=A0AAD8F7A0_BIOPF|nr:serine/threonine-protein phosphatase 6 regulatory ankyrin repeat subunit A [Biomphalaria pfeifferi]
MDFDLNDAILFRTVRSGASEDVWKLIRMSDNKLTSFSNHALNWSVVKASNMGHKTLLPFLLQDGARIEVRDDYGNTPLLICSEQGDSTVVGFLLSKGADVNAANHYGNTALILATSRDVIKQLLNHTSVDVDQQNCSGSTALMNAIERLDYTKILLLITAGACVNGEKYLCQGITKSCIYLTNSAGESALEVANRVGVGRLIELLHQAHISMCPPLVYAAINSDLVSFHFLLQQNICQSIEIESEPYILHRMLQSLYRKSTVGDPDVDMLKKICSLGVNVNLCSQPDQRPISLAVEMGNYDIVETLCLHGALISHDVLIGAVKMKYANLIPLLAVSGAHMNLTDERGSFIYQDSALDAALTRSDIGSAKLLLYHGSELDLRFALKKAAKQRNWKSLIFLLDLCPDTYKSILEINHEIFHESVAEGDVSIIEALLASGADIHGIIHQKTPLMNAVDIDVIKYLLDNGADVNFKTNTTTLIHTLTSSYRQSLETSLQVADSNTSSELQHINILNVLLDNGALLNDINDAGQTALINSVTRDCSEKIIKFFLNKGCKINQVDTLGNTALHKAASSGNIRALTVLLNHGANVNLQNTIGRSPLHEGVHGIFTSSVITKALLDHNADVHIEDSAGNTPLLLASTCDGNDDTVELLVAAGSRVNHTNHDGMSSLMIAVENINESVMLSLLKANADVDLINTKQHPKTALSILLNKWYPNLLSQHLALELLKHGASTKFVLPEVLHRIIVMGNVQLVQQLIASGLAPTDIFLRKELMEWPLKTISPLSVCLMTDQLQLAKYLIDNWYLTRSDLTILSQHSILLNFIHFRSNEFLKEHSSQPSRLELLSFVCVSASVGSGPDRADKVKQLCLPPILKDCLLFKKVAEEKMNADENDDENIFFCHQISSYQLDKDKYTSDFYEKDEEFLEFDRHIRDDSSVDEDSDVSPGQGRDDSSEDEDNDVTPGQVGDDNRSREESDSNSSQHSSVSESDSNEAESSDDTCTLQ